MTTSEPSPEFYQKQMREKLLTNLELDLIAAITSEKAYSIGDISATLAKPRQVKAEAMQAANLNEVMPTDITRDELTARIELVEARSDARLGRFEERINQSIEEARRDRAELKQTVGTLSTTMDAKLSGLRTTIITTGVTVALTIVLGVAAFNSTVLSNMVASFESGKNTASALEKTSATLEKLQDKITELQRAKPVEQPAKTK